MPNLTRTKYVQLTIVRTRKAGGTCDEQRGSLQSEEHKQVLLENISTAEVVLM